MQYYSVDRIETDTAICETDERHIIKVPLSDLPKGVREGDILSFDGTNYAIDTEKTRERRRQAAELQKKLFGEN